MAPAATAAAHTAVPHQADFDFRLGNIFHPDPADHVLLFRSDKEPLSHRSRRTYQPGVEPAPAPGFPLVAAQCSLNNRRRSRVRVLCIPRALSNSRGAHFD